MAALLWFLLVGSSHVITDQQPNFKYSIWMSIVCVSWYILWRKFWEPAMSFNWAISVCFFSCWTNHMLVAILVWLVFNNHQFILDRREHCVEVSQLDSLVWPCSDKTFLIKYEVFVCSSGWVDQQCWFLTFWSLD